MVGRKKKSAVAKLAERKRRGSECGSEFGSIVSIQRGKDTGGTTSKTLEPTAVNSNNTENKNEHSNTTKNNNRQVGAGVSDKEKDVSVNTSKTSGSSSKLNPDKEIGESVKDFPPKPVPRRLNRSKPTPDDLDGGTVVSIYDKRDQSPSRRLKRDKSPKHDIRNSPDAKAGDLGIKAKENNDIDGDIFTFLGPRKPKSGLNTLGLDKASTNKRNVLDHSPPVPMDLDNDSEEEDNKNDPDTISKNAPSDATVHRFRAMRMTPDRSRSEESLKNAVFAPKPPATPRSARRASSKGEKRNRESNSSGEEADIKKQNSVTMDISDNIMNTSLSNLQAAGNTQMEVVEESSLPSKAVRKGLHVHPDVKEVKRFTQHNINHNMHDPKAPKSSDNAKTVSEMPGTSHAEENKPDKSTSSKHNLLNLASGPVRDIMSDDGNRSGDSMGKKSDKKNKVKRNKVKPVVLRKELKPLDGAETTSSPGKSNMSTLGSASDLKAISEKYEQVLNQSPLKHSDIKQPSTDYSETVIPEPKAKAGKLEPIQPKSFPPPLPQDMKSVSLRTQYKNDTAATNLAMNKFFGRSFSGSSEKEKTKYEPLTARSLSTSSALPMVSTREARDR